MPENKPNKETLQFAVKILKENEDRRISLKQYNTELQKAEVRIANGQSTSHQQLVEESKSW